MESKHISAEIIADSICKGKRITTLQIQVPRIILAEFNTHRMFCRNFSSSRAIPAKKLRAEAWNNPFIPVYWGANKSGMSAKVQLDEKHKSYCQRLWTGLGKIAVCVHWAMEKCGLHKQTCNRVIEPWLSVTGIVTATEWDNFFKLRISEHAQPEMRKLAEAIKAAIDASTPEDRDFHMPWLDGEDMTRLGEIADWDVNKIRSLAAKVSVARTCRVSYNNMMGKKSELEADIEKFDTLLADGHFSPFESVAVCIKDGVDPIYHSRNFRGWCPLRSFIEPEDRRDLLAEKYGLDLR